MRNRARIRMAEFLGISLSTPAPCGRSTGREEEGDYLEEEDVATGSREP